MTRPLGLTHLLPGEQSVSNEHAMLCTLENTNAKAARLYFVLIFFMCHQLKAYLGANRRGIRGPGSYGLFYKAAIDCCEKGSTNCPVPKSQWNQAVSIYSSAKVAVCRPSHRSADRTSGRRRSPPRGYGQACQWCAALRVDRRNDPITIIQKETLPVLQTRQSPAFLQL